MRRLRGGREYGGTSLVLPGTVAEASHDDRKDGVESGGFKRRNLLRLVPVLASWLLVWLFSALPSSAFNFGGSALAYWGSSETLQSKSDTVDQRYFFSLRQELTAFLNLDVAYTYFEFTTQQAGGATGGQRRRTPRLSLRYQRPALSADLQWEATISDGTSQLDDFEAERFSTGLFWEPSAEFSLSARFSDTSNVADVAALGRDVDQQSALLQARYRRRYWRTSYLFTHSELDNRGNQFSSVQERHEGRVSVARGFLDQRLSLGFNGSLSQLDSEQKVGSEAELAEPIPAFQGLFVVNLTPEIGELEVAPGLIDGDFFTPVPVEIDIGGGKTFRNVGLDLGLVRPVTHLELSVDRPSGRNVIWAVYKSADNVLWEEVLGTSSVFDAGIQRYTVRFPETSERYFKVVNLSVNPEPIVLVTEMRALLEVENLPGEQRERKLYSADLSARFRTRDGRMDAQVSAGGRNDESLTAGLVRRDYEQRHATARLSFQLAPELVARAGYRYAESDNRAGAELFRRSEMFDSGLVWTPLQTVRADLSLQRREESERDGQLRTTDSVTLLILTELLPDLDLSSRVSYSSLASPGGGGDRTSWTWSETMRSRPLPRWNLDGSLSYSQIESDGGERQIDRTSSRLTSTWAATAYLSLRGEWGWSENDRLESLRQRYGLGYAPGPKLNLSLNYDEFSNDLDRETNSQSISAQYVVQERFRLLADVARSETSLAGDLTFRNDTFRVGFNFYF